MGIRSTADRISLLSTPQLNPQWGVATLRRLVVGFVRAVVKAIPLRIPMPDSGTEHKMILPALRTAMTTGATYAASLK